MSAKGETAAITPEMHRAIATAVDRRVMEIQVTKEDFSDLRAIVTEIAVIQRELARAQARTEEKMGSLEAAMAKLNDAVTKLTLAQTRTEEAITNLRQDVSRMSDTLGYGLEDLGEWVLPAYFERTYKISGIVRCTRKFIKVDGKEIEVNLYAEGVREGELIVLLGETKNRIGEKEVKKFVRQLKALEGVFDKPVFLFIFGFWAHPSAERLARENGIAGICSYQLTRS
jgi:predicted nuclease with TOPRIM domain